LGDPTTTGNTGIKYAFAASISARIQRDDRASGESTTRTIEADCTCFTIAGCTSVAGGTLSRASSSQG
jgi:hypothetical protein